MISRCNFVTPQLMSYSFGIYMIVNRNYNMSIFFSAFKWIIINEMNDPSIARTSDDHVSSPLSSLSSTKPFIFFLWKLSIIWLRMPRRISSPLKLTKTSYFLWGELLSDLGFSSALFSFWINQERKKNSTQTHEQETKKYNIFKRQNCSHDCNLKPLNMTIECQLLLD